MRLLLLASLLVATPTALAQVALFAPAPGQAARLDVTAADLTPRQLEVLGILQAELGVEAVEIVTADVTSLMDATALELAFPGETIVLERARAIHRPSGLNSWIGTSDPDKSSSGRELLAAFVTADGMVTGSVRSGAYLYEVRPLTEGLHAISRKSMVGYRLHGDRYAAFEAAQAERIERQRHIDARRQPPSDPGGQAGETQARAGGATMIDVLMPYTTNVTAAYADPAALAQSFIDFSNAVYVNSGVGVILTLVATYETPFASTGDLETDLNNITGLDDGVMDEAHGYRDAYGADLVALLAGTNSFGLCGIAWTNPGATQGFSANSGSCGAETITHEIGHNFGAQHDPVTGGTAPYSYGRGYVNDVGKWGTIMAYNAACTGQLCEIIPYLSSPLVSYDDTTAPEDDGPTGDAATADNARVHRERAATLAAFRAATAGPGVFATSPASFEVPLAPGASSMGTATVSNTAGAGSSDLTWTATLTNVTGPPVANACTNGQTFSLAGNGTGGRGITAGGSARGQSFVAPCTGLLSALAPSFFPVTGTVGTDWTGTYHLYQGDGTGGTLLVSIPVAGTNPTGGFYTVEAQFPSPAQVTFGDTYTWFIQLASGATHIEETAAAYADGSAYWSPTGDPAATQVSAFDLTFTATFLAPGTWVDADPRAGTLAAGASTDVDLTFDATGLAEGTYTANLVLTSNAIADPTATLPITLTVADGLTGTDGWRMLAIPGTGTYDDLFGPWWTQGFPGSDAPIGGCNAFSYDETQGSFAASWACLSNQTAPWAAGTGILAYVFADDDGSTAGVQGGFPKPLIFTGTAGTAPHTFSGLTLSAGTPGEVGWHLLGNPLATAFDWDLVTFPNSRLEAGVHVYDPTFNTTGDFRTYVQGVGGDLPNGWVPAFQGFFVQANTDDASLEIPTAAVPGDDPGVYGRTASDEALDPLRLQLSLVDDGVEHPVSTAYIASAEAGEIGPDPRDAVRLPAVNLPSAALSTGRPGEEAPSLVINTLPPEVGDLELPMEVSLDGHAPGTLSLSIAWTGLLPEGWTATLRDREADVDLVLEDGGRYDFEVTVPEGSSDATAEPFALGLPGAARLASGGPMSTGDRFALRLASSAVSVGDEAAVAFELSPPVPNPAQGIVHLRYSLDVAGPVRLVVFDALGRQVALLADGEAGVGTRTVVLDATRLAPGVYLARLEGPSGALTQRLTVVR